MVALSDRYQLSVECKVADASVAELFARTVGMIHPIVAAVAANAHVDPFEVVAIIADDFTGAVQSSLDEADDADTWGDLRFTTERVGGTVAAKNIALADDGSLVHVVFDAAMWLTTDPTSTVAAIYLVAHELAHVVFGRLRWSSGALARVKFPSYTPIECARSITRIAVEEYRADRFADAVLGQVVSVTVDDEIRPARSSDAFGASHRARLADVLDDVVYPGWRDTVWRYRLHEIELNEMWRRIVEGTDQVLTLLAHSEAEAAAAGELGPLDYEYAEHRGVLLYLGPAWQRIVRAADGQESLCDPATFAAQEWALLDEGEAALIEMWSTLGLTVEVLPDRQFAIWVSEPAA